LLKHAGVCKARTCIWQRWDAAVLKAIFQLVPSAQRADGLEKTLLPVAFA